MVDVSAAEIKNEVVSLRPSVTARIAGSYLDMRSAVGELISEKPSEARLLMFVLLSDMLFILSWSIKTIIAPTEQAAQIMGADMAVFLLVTMMLRTAGIYALAAFVAVGVKLLGGNGTIQETRIGVIWGVFVAAPIGLAIAGLAVLINALDAYVPFLQSSAVQTMPYWLGVIPFVWFVAKGAASANRKNSSIPLFALLSILTAVLAFAIKNIALS